VTGKYITRSEILAEEARREKEAKRRMEKMKKAGYALMGAGLAAIGVVAWEPSAFFTLTPRALAVIPFAMLGGMVGLLTYRYGEDQSRRGGL